MTERKPVHEFDDFYRGSHSRLLRQLVLVTADPAEAEDCLQEAYLRASMRWDRLVSYEAPEAWVRRVAINLAANRAKRLRRRAALLLRLGPPSAVPALSAESVDLAKALTALPVGQRQVIALHYLTGLPVAEIAEVLGISESAVKVRLHRGRKALAALLADDTIEGALVNE
jgi:RNA polymerase sigma-70 factor (ECF subfamily)